MAKAVGIDLGTTNSVIAAVEASVGNSLPEVAEAAASAYTLPKVDVHQ